MAYITAMMIYIAYVAFKKTQIGIAATVVTVAGFVLQTLAIVLRWKEFADLSGMGLIRSAPMTNLYESLIFFVWCLILAYLIIEFRYKNRSFGAFITPIAGLALAFIDLYGISKDIQPLVPALKSNWLLAHVSMSFIAYAAFSVSFSTGIMYLIMTTEKRDEPAYIFWTLTVGAFAVLLIAMGVDFLTFHVRVRPEVFIHDYLFRTSFLHPSLAVNAASYILSLAVLLLLWRFGHILKSVLSKFSITPDMLDEITYKSIAVGFPIFTLGGLIFGAIWADQAWGVYWSWDPKETWSLITWFIYAFYLHGRMIRGWRGRKVAIVSVVGFMAVLFTYLGVNLLLSGLHSYGSR